MASLLRRGQKPGGTPTLWRRPVPASPDKRAKNELLFREVNERVFEIRAADEKLEILCECGSAACVASVEISEAKYEAVRRNARHFVVLPGHEIPDRERVVGRTAGYLIVAKLGELGEIAERFDPRTPRAQ